MKRLFIRVCRACGVEITPNEWCQSGVCVACRGKGVASVAAPNQTRAKGDA